MYDRSKALISVDLVPLSYKTTVSRLEVGDWIKFEEHYAFVLEVGVDRYGFSAFFTDDGRVLYLDFEDLVQKFTLLKEV